MRFQTLVTLLALGAATSAIPVNLGRGLGGITGTPSENLAGVASLVDSVGKITGTTSGNIGSGKDLITATAGTAAAGGEQLVDAADNLVSDKKRRDIAASATPKNLAPRVLFDLSDVSKFIDSAGEITGTTSDNIGSGKDLITATAGTAAAGGEQLVGAAGGLASDKKRRDIAASATPENLAPRQIFDVSNIPELVDSAGRITGTTSDNIDSGTVFLTSTTGTAAAGGKQVLSAAEAFAEGARKAAAGNVRRDVIGDVTSTHGGAV
ncbi:MAG: hypothetical protein LQ344_000330 [Seirophora lacunosa]|nr:MAG: hypothetical protein LQ344_000330 [Seirophora lacunosa]